MSRSSKVAASGSHRGRDAYARRIERRGVGSPETGSSMDRTSTANPSLVTRRSPTAAVRWGGMFAFMVAAACSTPSNPTESSSGSKAAAETSPAGASGDASSVAMGSRASRSPDLAELRAPDAIAVVVSPWTGEEFGGGLDGSIIATPNYRLYSTLRDDSLERILPRYMESAFDHYRTAIVELPLPPEPLKTYIFGSRSEWNRFTEFKLPPREAQSMLQLRRGAYTADAEVVLHDLGRTDTLFLTAHEGWHQYTQSVFRESLPIWLEEGIATYMEGHRFDSEAGVATFMPWRNLERYGELRARARRGGLIPLEEIVDRSPQSFLENGSNRLLTYYAQVWALTQFLVHGENGRYRAGLERLLVDAVDGRVSSRIASVTGRQGRRAMGSGLGRVVISVYFTPDFELFKEQYEAFLAVLMQRGTGTSIWRGRNPFEAGASAPPIDPAIS